MTQAEQIYNKHECARYDKSTGEFGPNYEAILAAIQEALDTSAAKERERMKGVFEQIGKFGDWENFANGMWRRYDKKDMKYESKTTDELISIYNNKK